jgi:hypothetical protein
LAATGLQEEARAEIAEVLRVDPSTRLMATTGEIKIGDTALDNPSKPKRARRERMKREG